MIWLPIILILPYIILLFKYYNKLARAKPYKITAKPSVFVSVIVPCRNEEQNISRLLNSLHLQDYPGDLFEVIVVNDNSTDKTYEVANQYHGIQKLRIINNKGKGKKSAIRDGISIALGRLIITTDADCYMGESWVSIIASYYQEHNPDMIICPVRLESGAGFFSRFQDLEFLSLQGITAGSALSGKPIMCNGANLAFGKETYLRHSTDLHDEINSGDDIFLLHSLKCERNSIILWIESPEAIVTAKASATPGSFLQQRKRWISKSAFYTDRDTILTGILTFSIILLEISYLIGSLINPILLAGYLLIFLLKSIPDFLIIRNTAGRYGKSGLLRWFLPSQVVYPFYVISVLLKRNPQSQIRNPLISHF